MGKRITFSFSGGTECRADDWSQVRDIIQKLTTPGASLVTNPAGLEGYLDFHVLDDKSIEMEIMERTDDDFATIDIPTAVRVVEIAMTDTRGFSLRQKLEGLSINWL